MSVTIATIDAEITALLALSKWDYTEGDVSVKLSPKMLALLKMRESLLSTPDVDLKTMPLDFNVSEFGQDKGEYES